MVSKFKKGSPAGQIRHPSVPTNPLNNPTAAAGFNPLTLNTDDIFNMQASFGGLDSDNAVKFFMEAGKDYLTNLVRSNIPDRKTQNAIIRSYERYRRWNDGRHMQMLIEYLVSSRAIGSFATIQAQQVAIQIMAEQLMIQMTGKHMSKGEMKAMEADIDRQQALKAGQGGNQSNV
jgi:hypothetical protein